MKKSDKIFAALYSDYPQLEACKESVNKAFALMLASAENNATVMVCGNGGSAADSEHITGELMKGFNLKRPLGEEDLKKFEGIEDGLTIAKALQKGIKAISLVSQSGVISAYANDCNPEYVFAQQVFAYAQKPEDVLIALSTSGNSKNIVAAVKTAKAAGIKSVAVTGEKESRLSEIADVTIMLPSATTYKIQEYTLPVYHALCAAVEAEMFAL